MLNPIVASAVFGLVKGALLGRGRPETVPFGTMVLLGPLQEELMYRAAPGLVGMPVPISAFAFAADHLMSDAKHNGLESSQMPLRFADVFVGGLLYGKAYKEWGLLGAFAAHALHNLGCRLGARAGTVVMP